MKYMMMRKLQDEWKKTAEKNNREASALFTYDGFFPGYQDAETKVVFIGRESRFSASRDRIADDLAWFGTLGKNEGMGNYWNRIFYIFYGIQTRGKLLDTYHFSAPGNDRELFYDPITELLF